MNKYSEMSDFEVNKLIIEKLLNTDSSFMWSGNRYIEHQTNESDLYGSSVIIKYSFIGRIVTTPINFIGEFDQAMKLMIDNNISLICREFSNKVEWHACKNGIGAFNVKPCRAIAECFLLIKDEERGNEKAQKEV